MIQHVISEPVFSKWKMSKIYLKIIQPLSWILLLIIILNDDFNQVFRRIVAIIGFFSLSIATSWALYDFFFLQKDCLEIIYSKELDLMIITYEYHNYRR